MGGCTRINSGVWQEVAYWLGLLNALISLGCQVLGGKRGREWGGALYSRVLCLGVILLLVNIWWRIPARCWAVVDMVEVWFDLRVSLLY